MNKKKGQECVYEIRIYEEEEKHGKYSDEVYKPENDDKDADIDEISEIINEAC